MRKERFPVFAAVVTALAIAVAAGQVSLDISRHDCPVAGLPAAFADFRIVQLSDLHGASFGANNRRLVEKVRDEKPDIIVLTGDFIENADDLAITGGLFPQLAGIAPCYFVSGNHEWGSGCMAALAAQLETAGVRYLKNEYIMLQRDGSSIVLCGAEDPYSWGEQLSPEALAEEAAARCPGKPVILLGHRNDWVREYPELPVELILCGHGHGGIVRIPGVGGLVGTDRHLFPGHTEGIHASGSYHMVVSRGLSGVRGLPRIFNPPEIVVAVLKKEA